MRALQIDGRWLFDYNGWNWTETAQNPVGAEYGIGIAIREERSWPNGAMVGVRPETLGE